MSVSLAQPSQPLVSVIVPVYKAEHFLDECVRSIAGQTYRQLEILLIDDASPDRCPEMCDSWAERDTRVSVIHMQQGGGASGARNAGLDCCSGDYVMFVDSDDVLDAEAVQYSVEKAIKGGYGLVVFGKRIIDEQGKAQRTSVIDHDMTAMAGASDYYTTLSQLLRVDYLNPPWGKLFARRLMERTRFDTAMCYEEDLEFVLRSLDTEPKPNVFASAKALYGYRHMDSGMASVFKREKSLNVVQANHTKLRFFGDHMQDQDVTVNVSFHMANDIGWVIPMIRRAAGIPAGRKADYVMEMTGDTRLRPMVMRGLGHAWMTRMQKLLIALNWRWLWKLYLK